MTTAASGDSAKTPLDLVQKAIDSRPSELKRCADPAGDRLGAALALINEQDEILASIQHRSAEAGFNLVAEIRELDRLDERHGYSA